ISEFPTATAAVRAAYPERFATNAAGELISIDTRPVNLKERRSEQLRWGVNYALPLGNPPGSSDRASGRAERGGGGLRGALRRDGGRSDGRIRLSLYHSWQLVDE